MINLHESTLALSVYRAVQRCGALTPVQVIAFLQKNWEPEFDSGDLAVAMKYLEERGLARIGETIRPTRAANGVAATVIRDPRCEADLIYGSPGK